MAKGECERLAENSVQVPPGAWDKGPLPSPHAWRHTDQSFSLLLQYTGHPGGRMFSLEPSPFRYSLIILQVSA